MFSRALLRTHELVSRLPSWESQFSYPFPPSRFTDLPLASQTSRPLHDILSLMHPKEKFRAIYAIRLKFAHFMKNKDVTRAQKYP